MRFQESHILQPALSKAPRNINFYASLRSHMPLFSCAYRISLKSQPHNQDKILPWLKRCHNCHDSLVSSNCEFKLHSSSQALDNSKIRDSSSLFSKNRKTSSCLIYLLPPFSINSSKQPTLIFFPPTCSPAPPPLFFFFFNVFFFLLLDDSLWPPPCNSLRFAWLGYYAQPLTYHPNVPFSHSTWFVTPPLIIPSPDPYSIIWDIPSLIPPSAPPPSKPYFLGSLLWNSIHPSPFLISFFFFFFCRFFYSF